MFGYTAITIDSKGRLAIPAKFRDQLLFQNEESIAVTRDPQYPALKIYPGSIWNEISQELQSLQGLDPIVRNLQWTILGNAHETYLDINGRMLLRIPSDLQKYAEIEHEKQIALVGMGERFEIWNINSWKIRQQSTEPILPVPILRWRRKIFIHRSCIFLMPIFHFMITGSPIFKLLSFLHSLLILENKITLITRFIIFRDY